MKFRINYILAILGFIFTLDAVMIANRLSFFSNDLFILATIVLLFAIIGLTGIYFSNKTKYKTATIIYIIIGLLVMLSLNLDSALIGGILYIIAGIIAYIEGRNDNNNNQVNTFGQNNNQIENNNTNNNNSFDKKLLLIPIAIIAVILILLLAIPTDTSDNLNVSNVTLTSQGYSMYKINCNLIPNKEYSYLELVVVLYDEDNAQIGKSPLVWNTNNPAKGQLIKVSGYAYASGSNEKPVRAELYFYDRAFSSGDDDPIYMVNATI